MGVSASRISLHQILIYVLLGTGLTACGTRSVRFPFEASSITPAATGEVVATPDRNGNTRLKIDVENLAPPDRVMPGATVYVVWATGLYPGAIPRNLGALRVDKDLRGTLQSATPLQSFDLTITAEELARAAEPGGTEVLHVRISPRS
jgi:hypothetical protein